MPPRRTIESCASIDVRDLRKRLLLKKPCKIFIDLGEDGSATYTITETGICVRHSAGGSHVGPEQRIDFDHQPCRFGGSRTWLSCPACKSRRLALYSLGALFLCRWCHGLNYTCQHLRKPERSRARAEAIRRRLGDSASTADPFPEPPLGMHWSTYQKLFRRYEELEQDWLTKTARGT